MPTASAGIVVRALARRYGATEALAGIGFEVAAGEILGLLGPNGAGKTTTIEAIAGLVVPDAGDISVDGIDALADGRAARRRLGVVLQDSGLPPRIRPPEALRAFASLQGAKASADDLADLAARFGLGGLERTAVEALSGGQRQRLALALAFVGRPAAMLLDEPTSGLDPQMRRMVQEQIAALRDAGCAVLLATHDMAEAERLCDRVAILHQGRIVATGTPESLVGGRARLVVARTATAPPGGWPETLPGVGAVRGAVRGDANELRFAADRLTEALPALCRWLDGQGLPLLSLRADAPTLEELILSLERP